MAWRSLIAAHAGSVVGIVVKLRATFAACAALATSAAHGAAMRSADDGTGHDGDSEPSIKQRSCSDGTPAETNKLDHSRTTPALSAIDYAVSSPSGLLGPETGQEGSPGRSVPDGQQLVQPASEAGEGDTSLPFSHHGISSKASAGVRLFRHHPRGSSCGNDGSYPRQHEEAHGFGHISNSLVVSSRRPCLHGCSRSSRRPHQRARAA
eukprot:6211740-Pleurochrysis_carterae.AAC.2